MPVSNKFEQCKCKAKATAISRTSSTNPVSKVKSGTSINTKERMISACRQGIPDKIMHIRSTATSKKEKNVNKTLLAKQELERLTKASKVKTIEDQYEELERIQMEKQRIQKECDERKKRLRDIDDERRKLMAQKEEEQTEQEALRAKLLNRAYIVQQEQQQEVKTANRIILAAKCHIIRDAQVQEKQELARELKEEDMKYEKIMEEKRNESIKADEEKKLIQKEINAKHNALIKKQLAERERLKSHEAKKISEEAEIIAKAKTAIERDEQIRLQQKRDKTLKLRADLKKVSELNALFRKMEFEQENEAEMKVQEYMRVKEAREKQIELEKKLAKEAMERTQEQLVTMQQSALETEEKLQMMIIRREQDDKEREFRQKEKQAALRRKQIADEMAEARKAQLLDMKERTAIQLQRDEEDFKRIIESLKEKEAKEKALEQSRLRSKEIYREAIMKQIKEKQKQREEEQRKAKNEYMATQEAELLREKNVKELVQAKIVAMRNANMPEKFIQDVQKQLQITAK